jgi:hypothetical protein
MAKGNVKDGAHMSGHLSDDKSLEMGVDRSKRGKILECASVELNAGNTSISH